MLLTIFAACVGLGAWACDESDGWRKNPATNKCYKIPLAWVPHCECGRLCGPGADLACLASDADRDFITEWIIAEGVHPDMPDRKVVWIGNYKDPVDGAAED